MVRKAIRGSDTLKAHNISIYATGSYWNNTNVAWLFHATKTTEAGEDLREVRPP